jgi:hypothetical protein
MTDRIYSGLFVAEGSSDAPLADVVETLFFDRGVSLFLSKPDFARLGKVPRDVLPGRCRAVDRPCPSSRLASARMSIPCARTRRAALALLHFARRRHRAAAGPVHPVSRARVG